MNKLNIRFLNLCLPIAKKKNGMIKKRCSIGIIPTRYEFIDFIFNYLLFFVFYFVILS